MYPKIIVGTILHNRLPETSGWLYRDVAHDRTGRAVVGVMSDLPYGEKGLTFAPGETLFLYIDGVSEAMNPDGDMFEEVRIKTTLSVGHETSVDAVIDNAILAVGEFFGGASRFDDITCIVLRYNGAVA